MNGSSPAAAPWALACTVAQLFASDPCGTGIHVRSAAGPVRDRFLALLRALRPAGTPWRRCPASIGDDRLLGGLDLAATLAQGRAVVARGLLAEADGGIVVIAAAERLDGGSAARLATALETGRVVAEREGVALSHPARFGLVLLDEGTEDSVPSALKDRLAFRVDLDGIRVSETATALSEVQSATGQVTAPLVMLEALCATAAALGVRSLRAERLALRVARTAAALAGRAAVTETDAECAARLVLAHRATRLLQPAASSGDAAGEEAGDPPSATPGETAEGETAEAPEMDEALAEAVLETAVAALPPDCLAQLAAGSQGARAGGRQSGRCTARGALARPVLSRHGRPLAARRGRPGSDLRLDLVATLRAAAPWQRLRGRPDGRAMAFRVEDLHLRRTVSLPRTTTLFVVDASGSAAFHRLAEAKGAVELMLGECYLRRDQTALLAFRGTEASLLLPPTGALARARRSLSALPGGGATPLAAGIAAATTLAESLQRRGETPKVVLLTDGRANVALDGTLDRTRALADAERVARVLRMRGTPALVIDISPRPQPEAGRIAQALGARLLALPRADAAALSRAVRAA
ncbi:magnesium chelatase subunit D [Acidisoma sp. 7E03]